jgi:hypothetical protein
MCFSSSLKLHAVQLCQISFIPTTIEDKNQLSKEQKNPKKLRNFARNWLKVKAAFVPHLINTCLQEALLLVFPLATRGSTELSHTITSICQMRITEACQPELNKAFSYFLTGLKISAGMNSGVKAVRVTFVYKVLLSFFYSKHCSNGYF